MICEKCGLEFKVAEELKKLMTTGAVAQVCDSCAEAPPAVPFGHKPQMDVGKRTAMSILHRVDLLNAEGISIQWMSRMPLYPRLKRYKQKRPGRRDDQVEAFVMSFGSKELSNKPIMTLRTNLDNFQRLGKPFQAWKHPGFHSSLTGQDRIEVPVNNIDHIEDDGGLTLFIHLKDGGKVRLKYRNK